MLDPLGLDMSPPTEQERLYVERLASAALDPLEAAQSVGLGENDVVRLYAKPEVMRLMQTRLMAASVPWKVLLSKSKNVLLRKLDHEHPAIQLEAAKTVVGALKGVAGSLVDAAENEDKRSREQLVSEVLMLSEKAIDVESEPVH